MKQLTTYLLLLLSLLWITACSSDDGTEPQPTVCLGSEVQFNIGFAPISTGRMITDATFNSTFEDGDEIGVFARKNGTTDLVAQNVKLVRINGKWATATDADKIYYPLDGSKLDFYAYYPYQGDGNTAIDNISFAVLADQSTAADYGKSDLLTATSLAQSTNLVNLSFSHLMAMVQVTASRVAPVPTFREGMDGFKVILKNVKRSTETLHWANNKADVDGMATAEDITMYRVPTTDGSWVFRALIPSQEITVGELFTFGQTLQGNVIAMSYSLVSAVTPAVGKAASYIVTLDYQLDANHMYAIGDVYPYKGTPVGIVYWLNNPTNGRSTNGKIVSLDEGQGRWGAENVNESADVAGIRDLDDGKTATKNLITVRKEETDFNSTYYAFHWIYQKNNKDIAGDWYLPARGELQALYAGYDTFGKSAFNDKLTDAGGTGLNNTWHWSSSENGNAIAWVVDFSDGYPDNVFKDNYGRVRAVSAF